MKTFFLGTPEFAVPVLEKLAQSEFKPEAVFCAPDKPVGRHQEMTPPPVKIAAQKLGLPVYQPANKAELEKLISEMKPDLIISAAYGIIVSKKVLETPQYGCLNVHPSLLPKYRGASPIQTAILSGDEKTGVSIFKMDEGIDTGAVLAQKEFSIDQKTAPELSKDLSDLGAKLLLDILPCWIKGDLHPLPQDDSKAVYAPQIKKEDGRIDWQNSAAQIERKIRAYDPWPGAFTQWTGLKLKIIGADVLETDINKKPGEVFVSGDDLIIKAGQDCLVIKRIQLEGGKATDTMDFLRGHKEIIGAILN